MAGGLPNRAASIYIQTNTGNEAPQETRQVEAGIAYIVGVTKPTQRNIS